MISYSVALSPIVRLAISDCHTLKFSAGEIGKFFVTFGLMSAEFGG